MIDVIIALVVLVIVGSAVAYIVRAKKRGVKCIGCSACAGHDTKGGCGGNCGGNCDCH